jgi:serine/threonine protein kinase
MGIKELLDAIDAAQPGGRKRTPKKVREKIRRVETDERLSGILTGQVIDERYEIGEICGTGGLGELRYGFDFETGEDIVIKYPRPGLSALYGDTLKRIFQHEARVLQKIDNEHIVRAGTPFKYNGLIHIPMECLETGLEQVFREPEEDIDLEGNKQKKKKRKLTGKERREKEHEQFQKLYKFMVQAVQALKYLHRQNRVHCDVKPYNFMIDSNGTVKLTDFGSVRRVGDDVKKVLTTPKYAPLYYPYKTVRPSIDLHGFGRTVEEIMRAYGMAEKTYLTESIIGSCKDAVIRGNRFTAEDLEIRIMSFGEAFGLRDVSKELYTGVVRERKALVRDDLPSDEEIINLLKGKLMRTRGSLCLYCLPDNKVYKQPLFPDV